MRNSSKLIALRDMVRDLPFFYVQYCNGTFSTEEFVEHQTAVFDAIDHALLAVEHMEIFPQMVRFLGYEVDDSESENAVYTLKCAKRYRNSLCFQGGDWDLYLSCQNPWSDFSGLAGQESRF
jgi:hypothetical protein